MTTKATATEESLDAITDALLTASRLLVGISARSIARVDETITIPQFRTLVILSNRGPINLATLANLLGVQPSAAAEWWTGSSAPDSSTVNPTPRRGGTAGRFDSRGREVVRKVTARRRTEIARIVERMPASERHGLVRALAAFTAAGESRPPTSTTRPDRPTTFVAASLHCAGAPRLRRHPGNRVAGVASAHRLARHDVVAVLTRPDAASGRRGRPEPSPVARAALDLGIPLLRPRRPNSAEFVAELSELAPECCPVVAYGALLGKELLAIPPHGWVNLHFSLLPAWRGAAPVQAAIAAGDTITGATTFRIEPSLDSGRSTASSPRRFAPPTPRAICLSDWLFRAPCCWKPRSTASLKDAHPSAAACGGVSFAPKVTVEQARVRWDLPAPVVERRIRAFTPKPGHGHSSVTSG
ncbi:methionyl-tRNA formyltransferase domain protein [Mycobacterium xenopi 4042]|uniref:Methionyl-tRNA formyltransferase domain protein n=1 Tax=Mycobacterium xenopi 4042 TaxID=1299334 RepID=X7YQF6_MYCXE|nr:methionyl-tRNA formyltransferase domain protein [Mycobacterium xenopi 4042]